MKAPFPQFLEDQKMTMNDFPGRKFYSCFAMSRRKVQWSGELQSITVKRFRSSYTSRTISKHQSVAIHLSLE